MTSITFALYGDVHQKRDNIAETQRLLEWFSKETQKRNATPFFMGDLFDNFGAISLDVLTSWVTALEKNFSHLLGYTLVGNHDGDHSLSQNVLSVMRTSLGVLDRPTQLTDKVGAIPFVRDNREFAKHAMEMYGYGVRVILCHQEFKGCQMDNGYYSPNGVDPDSFPDDLIFVCGHIHRRSTMMGPKGMKVHYIGTPRHLTRSDIGEVKGITFMTVDSVLDNPDWLRFEFVPTPEDVAEPFRQYTITPENPDVRVEGTKSYVDVRGPKDFVRKVIAKLPEGTKVRSFPDAERRQSQVKESDGIPRAFGRYAESFFEQRNVDQATRAQVLAKLHETCPSLRG